MQQVLLPPPPLPNTALLQNAPVPAARHKPPCLLGTSHQLLLVLGSGGTRWAA